MIKMTILLAGILLAQWSFADCDWQVSSATPQEREDETGSLTTDALELKLKQFDECLEQDRVKEQQAIQAATAAAQAGASGSGNSGSSGQQAQTGEAGSVSASGQSLDAMGEDTGNESQDIEGKTPGSLPRLGGIPTNVKTGSGAPGMTDTIPQGVDNRLVEDDVAKLLREAAEKETDPKLKQELWDQYNTYMQSL